ncbi:BTB/POZ and TAZ domain-containing protein 4 [Vitis vinifera]|uniref:BTB/POZ and TAZ domain-containing protein 4 n=1 Tax=Vitis vinifera TaxID=29760 RepID=A0A438FBW8_VITVI|nr:BTB/POZ and TAZ domain-containing protein 4 [Vitis vinifera]
MGKADSISEGSPLLANGVPPVAPPLPGPATTSYRQKGLVKDGRCSCVNAAVRDLWDRLFDEACGADVILILIMVASSMHMLAFFMFTIDYILYSLDVCQQGMSSPVMKGMLKQTRGRGRWQSISIRGVPLDAVRVFIRFLYSSCYEQEDMDEFAVPLLVLSHVFVIPHLKRVCEHHLEHEPSNPRKEILESVTEADTRQKQRVRRLNEKKIYLELYEAMEALVHICRDGCRTIGPYDKILKEDQAPCKYEACKGLELLVRHFAGCKLRAPGGCTHCKRMWQLLELHSRLCADSDICRFLYAGESLYL